MPSIVWVSGFSLEIKPVKVSSGYDKIMFSVILHRYKNCLNCSDWALEPRCWFFILHFLAILYIATKMYRNYE